MNEKYQLSQGQDEKPSGTRNENLGAKLQRLLNSAKLSLQMEPNQSQPRTYESEEDDLTYAKAVVSSLAAELEHPTRLIINGQSFWFDHYGNESHEAMNDKRFEGLLETGEIPSFSESTSLDGTNQNIWVVQGAVIPVVQQLKTPVKVNEVWFDSQGAIVDQNNYTKFEQNFGINSASEVSTNS